MTRRQIISLLFSYEIFEYLHDQDHWYSEHKHIRPLFERDRLYPQKILHERQLHAEDMNTLCCQYTKNEDRVSPEGDPECRYYFRAAVEYMEVLQKDHKQKNKVP